LHTVVKRYLKHKSHQIKYSLRYHPTYKHKNLLL